MKNTFKWELKSFGELLSEPGCCFVRDLGGAEKMQKKQTTNEKTTDKQQWYSFVFLLLTLQNRSHWENFDPCCLLFAASSWSNLLRQSKGENLGRNRMTISPICTFICLLDTYITSCSSKCLTKKWLFASDYQWGKDVTFALYLGVSG